MPFDLHVAIGGLCLFVPDRTDGKLYVLMPDTDHVPYAPAGTIHQHVVRLLLPERMSTETPAQVEDCYGIPCLPLEKSALDFTSLLTNPSPEWELKGIVDLGGVVKRKVKRELLSGNAGGRVRSRLSFAAGSVRIDRPGGRWRLGKHRVERMATTVMLTIRGIQQSHLSLPILDLDGKPTGSELRLEPTDDSISIAIFHVPPHELRSGPDPKPPKKNEMTDHVAPYYSLFECPAETPLPIFEGDGEAAAEAVTGERAAFQTLGRPFTCILARGELEA